MDRSLSAASLLCCAAMALSCGTRQGPETRSSDIPESIDLAVGFEPDKSALARHRFMAIPKLRGCGIGDRGGIFPIYVTSAPTGRFAGDPIAVGDVIVGIGGKALRGDPVVQFRSAVRAARATVLEVSIARWRNGAVETFNIDLRPKALDLLAGGKRDKARDSNLGPTGLTGWVYGTNGNTNLSRQILVTKIDKGSPADGLLQKDDIIIGLGTKRFTSDARVAYANAITEAEREENKGELKLLIHRDGREMPVTLTLRVMGTYSDSAPFDCPKSKQILDEAVAHLMKMEFEHDLPFYVNGLALLASGRKECLPKLKELVDCAEPETTDLPNWTNIHANLFLTEYYLATRDPDALPKIKEVSLAIARAQSRIGTWGHSFAFPETHCLRGYGAMNQVGIPLTTGLVLAEKCGVRHPEIRQAIERSRRFLSFYTGKGAMPYGDHRPAVHFHDDDGKCSEAAVLFGLLGDFRAERFFGKMAIASYGEREPGHTGHFFGHLWGAGAAMRLGPRAASAFVKKQLWYFELARRWDGSFSYSEEPGDDYNSPYSHWDNTGLYALNYALPLRKLHITGKGIRKEAELSDGEIADVIEAGRGRGSWNKLGYYHAKTTGDLLKCLGSWSPAVRHRASTVLATRKDDVTPRLVAMLEGDDMHERIGACQAITMLKGRAAEAVDPLIRIMKNKDEDLWLRINTCFALRGVGKDARKAIPDMLRMAADVDEDDPRQYKQRYLAFALFEAGSSGFLAKSMESVDLDLLYPAVSAILKNEDGRARGAVVAVYRQLTIEQLSPVLRDILRATKEQAPSGIMYAGDARVSGVKFLADSKLKEGADLILPVIELKKWGLASRVKSLAKVLKSFKGHELRGALPMLKRLAAGLSAKRFPKEHELIMKKIKEAEEAGSATRLRSVEEFVEHLKGREIPKIEAPKKGEAPKPETKHPEPLPEMEAEKKATVGGKYADLLRVIEVKRDFRQYGEFRDYGSSDESSYVGLDNLPRGYWVYVYPNWYIFGRLVGDGSGK